MMGDEMENPEESSIPEPCFPRSPRNFPQRQRSKRRVIHKKATTVDSGFSGDQIVQEHPGPMLSTACARPRAHQKRKSKKVAEDSSGSKGCAHRKRKIKKFAEDSSDSEKTLPCSFRCRGQTKRRVKNNNTWQQGKLDDNIFDKYLGNLWRSFPSDKKDSFTYLDCLWFTMYANESSRGKVLSWIKRKKIFSKKYVFLPICKWSHWSLLIFCHLGENLPSKTKTPCMLLLDSLQTAEPKRLEPEIRKFLWGIFKAEERQETKGLIYKIPFLVPKVPQQRDDKECGNYVLYYLYLFLMSAPETFNISEGYPYFMKEDWFTAEGLESFCKTLDSSWQCRGGGSG